METDDETTFPIRDFFGFDIERAEGIGRTSLEIGEAHLNPNGVIHGATPFTMMDTAMGAAVMSVLDEGQFCATIEMHTRFHRGATSGRLTAEAIVLTKGRTVVHLEAKTRDDEGRLVASATGSFAVITPR